MINNILSTYASNQIINNNIIDIIEHTQSNPTDEKICRLQSAHTSFFPLWCKILQQKLRKNRPLIVVFPNEEQASNFRLNFEEFNRIELSDEKNTTHNKYQIDQHCIQLPSWGNVLGTGISEFSPIRSARASALYSIVKHQPDVLLCTIEQWNQFLPSPIELAKNTQNLQIGLEIDTTFLTGLLIKWGYMRVPKVNNQGEFALRGEVLDIFISKNQNGQSISDPIRINFDFEIIESIKTFSTENQMTKKNLDHIIIHPLSEFIWDKHSIDRLKKNINILFPEVSSVVLEKTIDKLNTLEFDEWDYIYGTFAYDNQYHIINFFDTTPVVLFANYEMLLTQEEFYWNKQKKIFLSAGSSICTPRYTRVKTLLHDTLANINPIPIYRNISSQKLIAIGDSETQKFAGNLTYFSKYLAQKKPDHQIFLSVIEKNHIERISLLLKSTLSHKNNDPKNNTPEILQDVLGLNFVSLDITQGFSLSKHIEVYTEVDLLGKKLHHFDTDKSEALESLGQIEEGDLIVHIEYGIGKFMQLTRMNLGGREKDFFQLEYANKEKLYIPIEQINMIQRYIGRSSEQISLDAIGGHAWTKRKKAAMEKIEDMSKELLEVHATRNAMKGFQFNSGDEWEQEFLEAFPFDETDDQIRAWEEISKDMEKNKPMDRLLVGDVGFGKTELAFRASFRAICSGKQVAFLVPTTILAEQHYYSAIDRFSKFPIKIAMLSRFLSHSEQKTVLTSLKNGEIDLIIGTHRIIQKDIAYKDLGLCIIDEEHRFGVKHKESIKRYREAIDCLSLSATPIPRTLYQSIVQLRDMSRLSKPPKKRKPIKTFVEKFDDTLVSKAIITELERGGQVFYLHNRIASLEEVKKFIEKLVPQASVLTASGQMNPKYLEDTMYRFINKGANVLISTTIIENGIDIPNVNTIIIDRADNYGIAQLYQLRGRVGRSDQVAYAYLLYPDEYSISEVALKRLGAISDNSELGAGFQIAMRDMEVRGSGNLLGKEQSGSIYAIGYEHYLKMLDETMKKLQGVPQAPEPILELSYTGFIPDTYVNDSITKMEIYKQIVSVSHITQYEELVVKLEDRYGRIPQEVRNLLWISKLKILCTQLFISSLKETIHGFELHFSNMSKISSHNIAHLINKGILCISPHASNILNLPSKLSKEATLEDKYNILNNCLIKIMNSSKHGSIENNT